MSEITPNPLANEMNQFKEEILKSMREFETKLTSKIEDKESALNNDYQSFIQKINGLMNNNKEMISAIISQKLKLEKIGELENFKNKVDSMLITHEIRIKNSLDEIDKIKTRYDKIIADNLYVTGYIGSSCQYKNMSEYINFNIAEVSRLKMEKEQHKKEIKELKNKFEGIMKTMITMNDNTVKLCNNYTDGKKVQFEKLLETAQFELNQKSIDMRAMAQKFQNDIDEKVKNIESNVNKVIDSETNLNNLINDNFYICEKQHEEIKKSISDEKDSINNNKKKVETIEEKIQNMQNKMKLIDVVNSKVSKLFDTVKDMSYRSGSDFNRNNVPLTKSIQSPSPKRILKRKSSNPDVLNLNTENAGIKNFINTAENNLKKSSKASLQKSVKFPLVKRMNLNTINTGSSTEDLNKPRSKRKEEKVKEKEKENKTSDNNVIEDSSNINQEKPIIIINESLQQKEKLKQFEAEKVTKIVKEPIKEKENKENEVFKDIEKEKEKEIEKEIDKSSILKNANLTNTIETLPIIQIDGKRSSKHILLKPMEIENPNTKNNISTIPNNDNLSQTNPNLSKMKKVGLEITKENRDCKIVSLKLSPDSAKDSKDGLSKSRRPPKPKYDIVNSLINDYKAKLLSKMHSPDQINEMNNEISEMPKRVTQAFGRTAYTFYFNKDNSGLNLQKKRNMNINIKSGLKNENENKMKK